MADSSANNKATRFYLVALLFADGDKRDRTADLLNAIQALSQLSYTPMCWKIFVPQTANAYIGTVIQRLLNIQS